MEEIHRTENFEAILRPAERLCSLPQQENIATVYAIATAGNRDQIWYEPVDAGSVSNRYHRTRKTQRKRSRLDFGRSYRSVDLVP